MKRRIRKKSNSIAVILLIFSKAEQSIYCSFFFVFFHIDSFLVGLVMDVFTNAISHEDYHSPYYCLVVLLLANVFDNKREINRN